MASRDSMHTAIRIVQMAFHKTPTDPESPFDGELGDILIRMGPEGADLLAAMTALATFAMAELPEEIREKLFAKPVEDEFNSIIEGFNE